MSRVTELSQIEIGDVIDFVSGGHIRSMIVEEKDHHEITHLPIVEGTEIGVATRERLVFSGVGVFAYAYLDQIIGVGRNGEEVEL